MIKYCPHCTGELTDNKKLAQNVRECSVCGARHFIIETSAPKKPEQLTLGYPAFVG